MGGDEADLHEGVSQVTPCACSFALFGVARRRLSFDLSFRDILCDTAEHHSNIQMGETVKQKNEVRPPSR